MHPSRSSRIGRPSWEATMLDKPETRGSSATAATALLRYQSGFLGTHETEALDGALPIGRNSPQRAPYGLYAEQLSGTAFTAPRTTNRRDRKSTRLNSSHVAISYAVF